MGSDHSDSTTRRTKRGRKSGTPPGENLAPKRTRYDVGAALASLPGAENAPAVSDRSRTIELCLSTDTDM